ncbi:hypothetical protein ABZ341_40005 [Streptomyces sp. NPDC006173]|uniref:nSTAND1 domain-containing NTPase n=1 Tax=Streptomyces sp. NPDC006173 TaxID=3155349 RepID=UPI003410DCE6
MEVTAAGRPQDPAGPPRPVPPRSVTAGPDQLKTTPAIPTLGTDQLGFPANRRLRLHRSLHPGARPLSSLAAVLADASGITPQEVERRLRSRPATALALLHGALRASNSTADGLTLVVDQSEEMYTLCRHPEDIEASPGAATTSPDSYPCVPKGVSEVRVEQ